MDGCFPPPSGKENNAHLLHHVWSTDTYRRQQAGTLLMHRLRSHLSGSHCCLMTGSAGSIFSGFRLVPRRAVNLPEPAAGGIRLPLPPLVREAGGEDKDGEGLKKGEKIDFAFECGAVLQRRQRCQQPLPPRKKKKKKINLRCRFKRPQTDIRVMETFIYLFIFFYQVRSNLLLSHEACLHFRFYLGSFDLFEGSRARSKNKWKGGLTKFSGPIFKTHPSLTISSKSDTP